MLTKNGKALTAKAVKPICSFHQVFLSTYLFGAFSPLDGKHFLLELPYCNAANFQLFLNELSKTDPFELKVMVLDNGAFHKAKSLVIPHNIILIFLPPYSPELNPAEKIWAKFKRNFTNRLFKTLDTLNDYICAMAKDLSNDEVKSITAFKYIFNYNYWSVL